MHPGGVGLKMVRTAIRRRFTMIDRRQALAAAAAIGASLLAARGAAAAQDKKHRVALHVDDNDADRMNMALNNANNVSELYSQKGEEVRSRSSPTVPACTCCAPTLRR